MMCGHAAVHVRWVEVGGKTVAEPECRAARAMMVLRSHASNTVRLATEDPLGRTPWCNSCGLWMLRCLGRTSTRRPTLGRAQLDTLVVDNDPEVARLKVAAAAEVRAWAASASAAAGGAGAGSATAPAATRAKHEAVEVPTVAVPSPDIQKSLGTWVSSKLGLMPVEEQAVVVQFLSQKLGASSEDEIEVDLATLDYDILHALFLLTGEIVHRLRWRVEQIEYADLVRAYVANVMV